MRGGMTSDLDNLMDFAVRTSEAAGRITLAQFGSAVVTFKLDGSELTDADTAAEEHMRSAIAEHYPEHGIFGEEGARVSGIGRFRWIVDPIDGTRSFASGVPLYGVLLALEERGVPTLGCCHFPVLSFTIVAARGAGCWSGGRRVEVSSCERLDEARIVTSGLEYWRDWATPLCRQGFDRLVSLGRFTRTWGDCYGYCMVASGRADVLADPACGARWDYAPMIPIITEAGGIFSTLSGGSIHSWSTALATNGRLHGDALSCWGGVSDDRLQTDLLRSRARAEDSEQVHNTGNAE
jgi:histidinol-phosphatase